MSIEPSALRGGTFDALVALLLGLALFSSPQRPLLLRLLSLLVVVLLLVTLPVSSLVSTTSAPTPTPAPTPTSPSTSTSSPASRRRAAWICWKRSRQTPWFTSRHAKQCGSYARDHSSARRAAVSSACSPNLATSCTESVAQVVAGTRVVVVGMGEVGGAWAARKAAQDVVTGPP